MGHDLDDDEIAIVISPVNYKDTNKWEGETNVSIAISPEHNLPEPIINGIVDVATMMSAFLDLEMFIDLTSGQKRRETHNGNNYYTNW